MNPKLPRIVGSVPRSFEFSSPAPGRPKVFWVKGINPEIVRECWSSQGELPYEERELPLYISSKIPGAPRTCKSYSFGATRKMVVYVRAQPQVRLVVLLDAPYDSEGEAWQPIARSSVERDRGVDPMDSRQLEGRLWDEICLVERRGRPRGTGHPKKPTLRQFLCLPGTYFGCEGKGLTTQTPAYSLDGGNKKRSSKSEESLGFRPRRSGSDGTEGLNQLSSD